MLGAFLFKRTSKKHVKSTGLPHRDVNSLHLFPESTFSVPSHTDISGHYHDGIVAYSASVPSAFVHVVKEGKVILGREEVFSKKGKVFRSLTSQPQNSALESNLPQLRKPLAVEGSILQLSLSRLEDNYYHFCCEFLARYFLYKKSGLDADYIIWPANSAFHREFALILGITPDRRIDLPDGSCVQGRHIIYPSLINNYAVLNKSGHTKFSKQWLPSWTKEIYRDLMLRAEIKTTGAAHRVYISRRKAKSRRIINEYEVVALLSRYDFSHVCLEDMSVLEQMALFGSARWVVAPHGAGIANIGWSSPGLSLLELFPPNYYDPSYRLQSVALGHNYHFHFGRDSLGDEGPGRSAQDFVVDLRILEKWLDKNVSAPS